MSNTIKKNLAPNNGIMTNAKNGLPLVTVFQQCYDPEGFNPQTDYETWDQCLNRVYSVRDPKPSVTEFGDAMYSVWKGEGGLSRESMIKALRSLKVYSETSIFTEVNKYYPNVNVTITIDNIAEVQKTNNLSKHIHVTDDNADPNQGSNELTITAKVGTTLTWKAVSKSTSDTVHLKKFVRRIHPNERHLFPENQPSLQLDGTFKGTLNKTGRETYAFHITFNNDPKVYSWDPYINSIS